VQPYYADVVMPRLEQVYISLLKKNTLEASVA